MAVPIAAVLEEYWSSGVRLLAGLLVAVGSLTAIAAIVSLDSDYLGVRLAAYCKEAYGFTISAILPHVGTPSGPGFMLSVFGMGPAARSLPIRSQMVASGPLPPFLKRGKPCGTDSMRQPQTEQTTRQPKATEMNTAVHNVTFVPTI